LLMLCPFLQGADTGGNRVTMFLTGIGGEWTWSLQPNPTPNVYTSGLGDPYFYTNDTEGHVFAVVGADGEICDMRVSVVSGELDAGETGTATLRRCAGGDVARCKWTSTSQVVTITGASGVGDRLFDTTGACQPVSAGDAVAVYWDWNDDDPPDGADPESPDLYLTFRGKNANESFTTSYHSTSQGFFNDYYWHLAGENQQAQSSADSHRTPIPGDFTLTGMFCSMESSPGKVTEIYLCEDDAGTDAGCGGQGTVRMQVDVPASGASAGRDTTCTGNCDFAAGDLLFLRQNSGEGGGSRGTSCGLRWTNKARQWWSAVAFTLQSSNSYFGNHSNQSVCNDVTVRADPQCVVLVKHGATAVSARGWIDQPLTNGSYTLRIRDGGANSGLSCPFTTSSGNACISEGSATIAPGARFNVAMLRATKDSGPFDWFWSVGILWNDMVDGD
jgi:hypothetical protein